MGRVTGRGAPEAKSCVRERACVVWHVVVEWCGLVHTIRHTHAGLFGAALAAECCRDQGLWLWIWDRAALGVVMALRSALQCSVLCAVALYASSCCAACVCVCVWMYCI